MSVKIITVEYNGRVYPFGSGYEAMIFDCALKNNFIERYGEENLLKYIGFIRRFPIDDFCDFVARNWEAVQNLSCSDVISEYSKR